MIVTSPWEYTALIQQLIANLEDSGRPGYLSLDMNLPLRETNLLQDMVQIFQALERGEPVAREDTTKGGEASENKM